MKNKKHIDQLFKDRFENFEPSPSPHVWEKIEAQLKKEKDDRKVIPLWWKFAGVAALLALLFTIGNTVFNTSDVDTTIVTEEKAIPETKNQDLLDKNSLQNTNDKVSEGSFASENDATPSNVDTGNGTETPSNIKTEAPSNTKEVVYKKSSQYNTTVASETNASEEKSNATNNNSNKAFNTSSYGIDPAKDIAVNTSEEKKKTTPTNTSEEGNNTIINSEKNKSLINKELGISETISTEIAQNNSTEETKEETALSEKKSILDEIKEQEVLKEEEAVAKNKTLDNRWDVAPNFAPVYYNTLSSGSSIDPAFADNSQSGDVNFSYGVQVSYALNERLSIRSGVSNVDLSYATGGVELGTGPVAVALKSINYNGTGTVITAIDAGTIIETNASNGDFGEIMPKSTNGEAQIIQSLSYYEVPLELKYAVLTKKFGVNLIGGLSTLFLGSNDVSVTATDFNRSLGEANNLSSVSFSTNVGLGFDYKISKKFKFNVEPMFKYQLNPYTDSSVDFKPYYLGVYTGFSYKF